MGIDECRTIELPVVPAPEGDLAFAEGDSHVPFSIARTFFVYGIPSGAARGGHAHLALEEAVFCLSGRLEITVDDGRSRRSIVLDHPCRGVYLPPMVWYDIAGFDPGTVYLALASAEFDEADYIRDYDEYLKAVRVGERAPTGPSRR